MKPLVIANWKCNPTTLKGAKLLFDSVAKGIKNACPDRSRKVEVVICPPFVYLSSFNSSGFNSSGKPSRRNTSGKPSRRNIKLGAQDCFYEEKGAFTGEVSPLMLKDLGCQYVICGHSEMRRHFGETDEMINKKIKTVLKIGLSPIFCVGGKKRESKEDIKEIDVQLEKGLQGLKKINLSKLVIVYEPIWAISTTPSGAVATPDDAMEGAIYIRKILTKLLGKNLAQKIKILYGGSVNSKNVRDFIYEARMDGVLVGAASLNPEEFVKLVKNTVKG